VFHFADAVYHDLESLMRSVLKASLLASAIRRASEKEPGKAESKEAVHFYKVKHSHKSQSRRSSHSKMQIFKLLMAASSQ
jgi:hypothetical protein